MFSDTQLHFCPSNIRASYADAVERNYTKWAALPWLVLTDTTAVLHVTKMLTEIETEMHKSCQQLNLQDFTSWDFHIFVFKQLERKFYEDWYRICKDGKGLNGNHDLIVRDGMFD